MANPSEAFEDAQKKTAFFKVFSTKSAEWLDLFVKAEPNAIHWRDGNGQTPLHCAVNDRSEDKTYVLLSAGAKPNEQNNFKISPLASAVIGRHTGVQDCSAGGRWLNC